jgi:hypothetical protein
MVVSTRLRIDFQLAVAQFNAGGAQWHVALRSLLGVDAQRRSDALRRYAMDLAGRASERGGPKRKFVDQCRLEVQNALPHLPGHPC